MIELILKEDILIINANMSTGGPSAALPQPTSMQTSSTSLESSLSEEEKLYDLDGDGKLSSAEEAAYLLAKQQKEETAQREAPKNEKETTVDDIRKLADQMKSSSAALQSELLNDSDEA